MRLSQICDHKGVAIEFGNMPRCNRYMFVVVDVVVVWLCY